MNKNVQILTILIVVSTLSILPFSSVDVDAATQEDGGWFYDQLSTEEKGYYDKLSTVNVGKEIKIHDQDAFWKAYYAFEAETSCSIFSAGADVEMWTYNDGSGYVKVFSRSGDDVQSNVERLKDAVSGFDFTGISSDYDAIVAINDYLVERITYNHDWAEINNTDAVDRDHGQDAYGALVHEKRSVVCEGYAEAFKALCDKYGIECYHVSGWTLMDDKLVSHAWNIVKMDDGNWYPVDVTWNDSDGAFASNNYLLCSASFIGKTHAMGYDYTDFTFPALSKSGYAENNSISDGSYTSLITALFILAVFGIMIIAELLGLYHLATGAWKFITTKLFRRNRV